MNRAGTPRHVKSFEIDKSAQAAHFFILYKHKVAETCCYLIGLC